MSSAAKRVKNREYQATYRKRHANDPEFRAKKAAQQRKYAHYAHVEQNIERDERVLADEKSARLAKRLSAAQTTLMSASQAADESESASDDSVQDADEAEYKKWNSAHLLELFEYARARGKGAFIRRTGLSQRAFNELWALVQPFYEGTSMDGRRRPRSAREPAMPNMLQFFVLLYWLRTVSHAFARPPARVLAIQRRRRDLISATKSQNGAVGTAVRLLLAAC